MRYASRPASRPMGRTARWGMAAISPDMEGARRRHRRRRPVRDGRAASVLRRPAQGAAIRVGSADSDDACMSTPSGHPTGDRRVILRKPQGLGLKVGEGAVHGARSVRRAPATPRVCPPQSAPFRPGPAAANARRYPKAGTLEAIGPGSSRSWGRRDVVGAGLAGWTGWVGGETSSEIYEGCVSGMGTWREFRCGCAPPSHGASYVSGTRARRLVPTGSFPLFRIDGLWPPRGHGFDKPEALPLARPAQSERARAEGAKGGRSAAAAIRSGPPCGGRPSPAPSGGRRGRIVDGRSGCWNRSARALVWQRSAQRPSTDVVPLRRTARDCHGSRLALTPDRLEVRAHHVRQHSPTARPAPPPSVVPGDQQVLPPPASSSQMRYLQHLADVPDDRNGAPRSRFSAAVEASEASTSGPRASPPAPPVTRRCGCRPGAAIPCAISAVPRWNRIRPPDEPHRPGARRRRRSWRPRQQAWQYATPGRIGHLVVLKVKGRGRKAPSPPAWS